MSLMKMMFGAKAASAARKVSKVARAVAPSPALSGPIRLAGSGDFDQQTVGEGYYQDQLDAFCGGKCEEGHEKSCRATLMPEPGNPHDKNAVAVQIGGSTVGYLPRSDAVAFHRDMRRLGAAGQSATCRAVVTGGWRRDRDGATDEGHYGVSLDVEWPLSRA